MNPSTAIVPVEWGPGARAVDSLPDVTTSNGTDLGPAPRLDERTLLVPGPDEGWAGTVYVASGEATYWRALARSPEGVDDGGAGPSGFVVGSLDVSSASTSAGDGERRERVQRRARGRARRYAVANGCSRLWTFTYRPDHTGRRPKLGDEADRRQVKRDWAAFARRLPPGTAWARTLEGHEDGSIHVHAALGRYLKKSVVAALWGHGFVDARRLTSRRSGRNENARAVARYVMKYALKSIDAGELAPGEHSYEVAQGFQPVAIRVRAWDRAGAWREVVSAMGGEIPSYEWDSASSEDWRGPPVGFVSW